jgi:alginate export protein
MTLVVLLAWGMPGVAAEVKGDAKQGQPTDAGGPDAGTAEPGAGTAPDGSKQPPQPAATTAPDGSKQPPQPAAATAPDGSKQPPQPAAATAPDGGKQPPKPAVATASDGGKKPAPPASTFGMPQFVIPKASTAGKAPTLQLPQRLTYQYAYGSQSEMVYIRDLDLNRRVRDDTLVFNPQLNGYITYRPMDWLETTLEMMLEREVAAVEEAVVVLPNGETQFAVPRRFSLIIDQLFVAFKGPADRFRFTVGRRNYEDEGHFLFDTSLDVASVSLKLGKLRAEAAFGREALVDLDLLGAGEAAAHQYAAKRRKDLINTSMLLLDYRGLEELKLGAYMVYRDDRARIEGQPLLMGLSAHSVPSGSFSYWGELGFVRGKDEFSQKLLGYGFDVGATYRLMDVPLHPSATLAYAFGSGNANSEDGKNREFRQTGLQSNESRFAGIAKFRRYGEVLDPELSNLRIITAGLGFRPAANFSVDLIYHRYWLNEIATDLRGMALTAQMNQVEGGSSRDVGRELDIVVGVRNLFGVRRLGVDLRVGWFFPGDAFLLNEGTPASPSVRSADNSFKARARLWW